MILDPELDIITDSSGSGENPWKPENEIFNS